MPVKVTPQIRRWWSMGRQEKSSTAGLVCLSARTFAGRIQLLLRKGATISPSKSAIECLVEGVRGPSLGNRGRAMIGQPPIPYPLHFCALILVHDQDDHHATLGWQYWSGASSRTRKCGPIRRRRSGTSHSTAYRHTSAIPHRVASPLHRN